MNTISKILFFVSLVLVGGNAFSQDSSDKVDGNPIDKRLKACLDSSQNETTVGMVGCFYEAEQDWDAELNKYYKLLMAILSPDAKVKLKVTEIKWLAFRDAESDFGDTIHADMGGTMWGPIRAENSMELVKQRALDLKGWYDDMNPEGDANSDK